MKVAVIGAGPAGLRCAGLLQAGGAEVEVFEARTRVGGRLHTVTTPDGWYEAGGEWIDADHARILGSLEAQGTPAVAVDRGLRSTFFAGQRVAESEHPAQAEAEAFFARVASGAIVGDTPAEAIARLRPEVRSLVEAVFRSDEGEDPDHVALAPYVEACTQNLLRPEGAMSAFRFPEGAERWCERLAEGLEVRLGRAAKAVQLGESQVEIWFEGDEVVMADRVVLALPPAALRRMEIEPEPDLAAWLRMGMTRTAKVSLRFRRIFWGEMGSLLTDLPVQQLWPAPHGATLMAYVNGAAAARLASSEDPVRTALESVASIFPEATKMFEEGHLHDWSGDRWAGGGFSLVPPGADWSDRDTWTGPYGRLHLAGEWTSRAWPGFIEGALESAERAAAEVLAAGAAGSARHLDPRDSGECCMDA